MLVLFTMILRGQGHHPAPVYEEGQAACSLVLYRAPAASHARTSRSA